MKHWQARVDEIGRRVARWRRAFRTRAQIISEAEALAKDVAELRERLIAAQKAKVLAENQAEDLRRQKERLRERVAEQKAETEQLRRSLDQAGERLAHTQAELDKCLRTEGEAVRPQEAGP